ncbi:hypothetical protein CROQUDRAFT_85357 [Cronartium quercuum f. sp. fusiforme G11]|uniref:Uncharacterized protein n=1 Tax=Cronartium quercuum f. sp. fusiforme G11 TaxID=708437 RepID=A0A9P6NRY0_9BASI|nr:hypothetical protein CROQUDRAFT_85357 [Cronartium quercuum f. sp. fusiforme G11]
MKHHRLKSNTNISGWNGGPHHSRNRPRQTLQLILAFPIRRLKMAVASVFNDHISPHHQNALRQEEPTDSSRQSKQNSLEPLRVIYHTAVKSFLHKDHLTVWLSLCEGLEKISSMLNQSKWSFEHDHWPWWAKGDIDRPNISSLREPEGPEEPMMSIEIRLEQELHELARKFNILRITFATSIYSPSAIDTIQSLVPSQFSRAHRTQTDVLLKLLALKPDDFISTLWTMAASGREDLECCLRSHTREALSSVWLMEVHPSIVTAAALASIKLSALQAGKALCEAWLSSLNVSVLDYLEALMRTEQVIQPTTASDSSLILNNSTDPPAKQRGSNICYNYGRLIEVYAVHILGSLDDRQFAREFVQGQSCEAGGVLPVETVKNVLSALDANELQIAQLAQAKEKRLQKEREAAAAAKAYKASTDRKLAPSPPRGRAGSERRKDCKTAVGRNRTSSNTVVANGLERNHSSSPTINGNRHLLSKSSAGPLAYQIPTLSQDQHQQDNSALNHYLNSHVQSTPSSSRGFAALRENLSRLISHTSEPGRRTEQLGLIKTICSVVNVGPIRLATIAAMLLLITRLRGRGNTRRQNWNPLWLIQRLVEWCWRKLAETARMGTRITYL